MQAPRNVRFCNKVACNFFTPYVSERDEMKNAASTISTPGAKADTFNSLDDADVLPPFTSTIITNNANARVNSNTMIDSTATATTPTTHVTKSGVAIKLAGTSSVFETTVDYRNGANCAHVCACSTAEECSCSYDSSHGHNHRGVRFEDGNGNDDVGSQNGQTHAQHGSASTNSVHASAIEVPSAPINSLHENKNQPLAVQPCAVRSLTPDEARRLNRAMREREAKRARERELDAMEKKASEKAAEVAKAFKEQKRKNRWDQVLPEPQMDTEKGDSFDDERPDPCSTGPIGTSEQMTAFVAAFARMHVSNVIKNNKGRVDDSKLVELERSTEGMIEQHISKIIADYATQPKRSDMTASFVTDHHHPRETTPETSAASTNTTQDYTTLLPAANSITAEGRTAIAYLEHDTLVSNRDDVAVKNASDNTTPQETIVTTIASVPTTTVTEATPSIETTTSTPTETAIDHPPIQPNDSNDRNAFLALKGREFANSIAHKTRIPDRYSYNDVKPEQLISVKCLVFFDCEYRNIIGIASHDTAKDRYSEFFCDIFQQLSFGDRRRWAQHMLQYWEMNGIGTNPITFTETVQLSRAGKVCPAWLSTPDSPTAPRIVKYFNDVFRSASVTSLAKYFNVTWKKWWTERQRLPHAYAYMKDFDALFSPKTGIFVWKYKTQALRKDYYEGCVLRGILPSNLVTINPESTKYNPEPWFCKSTGFVVQMRDAKDSKAITNDVTVRATRAANHESICRSGGLSMFAIFAPNEEDENDGDDVPDLV